MSDTMIQYSGESKIAITLHAQPDPHEPSHFLLKSENGEPLRGKFLLKEHAYNILMPPDSYIIIEADEAEMFKDSRSNDRVIFILPSDNPSEFYMEQYFTSSKIKSPYTVLTLRNSDTHEMISAALYPRDLESLPPPMFITHDMKLMLVMLKQTGAISDSPDHHVEHLHSPEELEFILNAVHRLDNNAIIKHADQNAPKESWF